MYNVHVSLSLPSYNQQYIHVIYDADRFNQETNILQIHFQPYSSDLTKSHEIPFTGLPRSWKSHGISGILKFSGISGKVMEF